ncbi:hypothetical protein RAB80_009062 [Fusarium oxysporum f. sp. vasinfectum]|uniref:Secreted protein n=1 Tax=Fusarium oxysporum f. sp. vasinfectum 25433 TaxID=1089449 RepID=X0KTV7_FUSOX|nr:hypothetical protein FOTG_14688 [Fusarium oxysporum f. sp. vasinfectum 25433]KAK2674078.1 hypothetical protein RAB80_009062 [Fusarium oxysporum f. sp. vasinfectum]KAK2930514.1 hypothetical protein FoTM2_008024 [Fusarium oxysporum f. sp. vasinfectum]
MKLLNIVLALVPLVVVSETACHQSGESWGSMKDSVLQESQKKTPCIFVPGSGKHADFEVKRLTGGSTTLSEYDCYYYLNREITGCDKGGRRAYDNWEFSADPNAGAC